MVLYSPGMWIAGWRFLTSSGCDKFTVVKKAVHSTAWLLSVAMDAIYCISTVYTVMPACRVWLSLHPLFSAYPLLGAYLLTTYTYKRMYLLTRVYGMMIIALHFYHCNSDNTVCDRYCTCAVVFTCAIMPI